MSEWIDRTTRAWAIVAIVMGVGLFLGLELREEPALTAWDLAVEALEVFPLVFAAVGVVLLFRITARQREDQLVLIRDLEVARVQGQRWRSEARTLLTGLGDAIDAQFGRWNLTDAEREVALLLLKGLSLKEVAAVRATSERTIRAQAQAIYARRGSPAAPRCRPSSSRISWRRSRVTPPRPNSRVPRVVDGRAGVHGVAYRGGDSDQISPCDVSTWRRAPDIGPRKWRSVNPGCGRVPD